MKEIIISETPSTLTRGRVDFKKVSLHGIELYIGLLETDDIKLDPEDDNLKDSVLVQKRAFSLNFRDKALIFYFVKVKKWPYFTIGSDFIGHVVGIGKNVTEFKIGDKVISNCWYQNEVSGGDVGIPTNSASRQLELFHKSKLINVPSHMPDEIGASFSIGSQTSYSMIRKLRLVPGEKVLVTAANSNTSLITISALKNRKVDIYALTTSEDAIKKLENIGVKKAFHIPLASLGKSTIPEISGLSSDFDCIIDPFFDLYIQALMELLRHNGRYITCGYYDQYSKVLTDVLPLNDPGTKTLLKKIIIKNIILIGNCLGTTDDIRLALEDYNQGVFNIPIDSTYALEEFDKFFCRSFESGRFGKVVYRYVDK